MHFSAAVWFATFCVWCAHRAPLVSAFPNGAPVSACGTLSPALSGHLVGPTDCPDPCPFQIQMLDRQLPTYSCGETVPLQLISTDQTTFRGFFIQSRETTEVFDSEAPFVGEFVRPNAAEWQIRPCSGSNAGATHVSRSDKTVVDLEWQAPPPGDLAPSVTFWLTIVQVRMVYHVRMSALTLTPDQQSCQDLQVVEFVADTLLVSEGTTPLLVCVQLLSPAPEVLFLIVATTSRETDTATDGEDYSVTQPVVIFETGAGPGSMRCAEVDIVDDAIAERNEIFTLDLVDRESLIDQTTVIIIDNEPPVLGFRNLTYNISEGETLEACVGIFSGGSNEPFSLQMVSVSGTAVVGPGGDAEQILTVVQFEGRSVEGDVCVEVDILPDLLMEPTEFFFLALFPRFGERIDPARMVASVHILDRAQPLGTVGFTDGSQIVDEDAGPTLTCILFTTDSPLEVDVQVTIQSRDGSAVSFPTDLDPPDYLSISTTITILSGTPSGTTFCASVSIVDDQVLENQEEFVLNLASLSPLVTVAEDLGSQTVYIIDNEPRVSVFRVSNTEIDTLESRSVSICITMVSEGPLLENVVFNLVPQNGSATEFEDFLVLEDYVHFESGSRRGRQSCASIVIVDDDVAEMLEEFTIQVFSTDEAVAIIEGESTVTISIEDDDGLYVGLVPPFIGANEADGEVFVCVTALPGGPVLQDRTVRIGTQDGSAIAMEDYIMQNTELTFPAGTQAGDRQCLGIPLIDNNRADGTRFFTVSIVSFDPLVHVVPEFSQKYVYIEDNDGSQVEFQFDDYVVVEDAGAVEVCVVLLGKTLTESGEVSVSTQGGSAIAGDDYVDTAQSLVFPAGSISNSFFCVSIRIINNTIAETNQSFNVILTSLTPDVFTVADDGGKATVTIIDDEVTGLPGVTFSEREIRVLENAENADEPPVACIILYGGGLGGQPASFDITSFPGSATAGADYTQISTTVTLPAFSPSGTLSCVSLDIIDDGDMEEREYFTLRLENQSPDVVTVSEGGDVQTVRILDDDSPMAVVGFQVIESTVNESVASKFTCIEVMSGGPLMSDAVIRFYTRDDTAVAPEDYMSVDMTLTFREGANGSQPSEAACVEVPIVDDTAVEETERLTFRIEAVDVDRIMVDEALSEKVLYIEDNDAVFVGFERDMYEVSEGLGPDFGLLVCVTVEDAEFPFQLATDAVDDTATEILDYRISNSPLQFFEAEGAQTQCTYVQVVNDGLIEGTEYFTLQLSSDVPAIVVTTPSALIRITNIDCPDII